MEQSGDDDLALLRAWQAGSTAAGRVLVARHYASVYRFFFAKVSGDACEDLAQGTFEALCRRRDAYRGGSSSFKGFLFGIARNKLLEYIRHRSRLGPTFDPAEDSVVDPATEGSLSSLLADRQIEHVVSQALRGLSLDDRIVLELKEYEGLTARELAELFGVPGGTMAGRIARARQRLREATDRLLARPDLRDSHGRDLDSAMRSIFEKIDEHLRRQR
ncbi:RNA polymerase sigma-70 factor, ECF subfamily [Nannocystis exedens]|uniref:RNA polymerase sigma-70 factor, ECF subfamily n=1 Tax=Nannocystis exedens TaxID=54 RepID=A0A1I1VQJ7_9BACT|nr:RNA polymerase sigma factor [Nannocystis exedens]PCC72751.1 RNA polymerase sigma 70 [Nannocystis exedens]SFD85276.1 RNA polymerase sigma-70 factor, ECF subfamily [Nannocystis exedens]